MVPKAKEQSPPPMIVFKEVRIWYWFESQDMKKTDLSVALLFRLHKA